MIQDCGGKALVPDSVTLLSVVPPLEVEPIAKGSRNDGEASLYNFISTSTAQAAIMSDPVSPPAGVT